MYRFESKEIIFGLRNPRGQIFSEMLIFRWHRLEIDLRTGTFKFETGNGRKIIIHESDIYNSIYILQKNPFSDDKIISDCQKFKIYKPQAIELIIN